MKYAQLCAGKRGDVKEHSGGLGVGDKQGLCSQSGNVRGDMEFGYRLFQGG
jgi:hypothetical protein